MAKLIVYPKTGNRFFLTSGNPQRKETGFAFSDVGGGVEGFIYFENVAAVIDADKNQKSDDMPNLFHVYLKELEPGQPRVVDIHAYSFKADCSEIVFKRGQQNKEIVGRNLEDTIIEGPIE